MQYSALGPRAHSGEDKGALNSAAARSLRDRLSAAAPVSPPTQAEWILHLVCGM